MSELWETDEKFIAMASYVPSTMELPNPDNNLLEHQSVGEKKLDVINLSLQNGNNTTVSTKGSQLHPTEQNLEKDKVWEIDEKFIAMASYLPSSMELPKPENNLIKKQSMAETESESDTLESAVQNETNSNINANKHDETTSMLENIMWETDEKFIAMAYYLSSNINISDPEENILQNQLMAASEIHQFNFAKSSIEKKKTIDNAKRRASIKAWTQQQVEKEKMWETDEKFAALALCVSSSTEQPKQEKENKPSENQSIETNKSSQLDVVKVPVKEIDGTNNDNRANTHDDTALAKTRQQQQKQQQPKEEEQQQQVDTNKYWETDEGFVAVTSYMQSSTEQEKENDFSEKQSMASSNEIGQLNLVKLLSNMNHVDNHDAQTTKAKQQTKEELLGCDTDEGFIAVALYARSSMEPPPKPEKEQSNIQSVETASENVQLEVTKSAVVVENGTASVANEISVNHVNNTLDEATSMKVKQPQPKEQKLEKDKIWETDEKFIAMASYVSSSMELPKTVSTNQLMAASGLSFETKKLDNRVNKHGEKAASIKAWQSTLEKDKILEMDEKFIAIASYVPFNMDLPVSKPEEDNKPSKKQSTANENNQLDTVKLPVENGTSINHVNKRGETAPTKARKVQPKEQREEKRQPAASENGRSGAVKSSVENGTNNNHVKERGGTAPAIEKTVKSLAENGTNGNHHVNERGGIVLTKAREVQPKEQQKDKEKPQLAANNENGTNGNHVKERGGIVVPTNENNAVELLAENGTNGNHATERGGLVPAKARELLQPIEQQLKKGMQQLERSFGGTKFEERQQIPTNVMATVAVAVVSACLLVIWVSSASGSP